MIYEKSGGMKKYKYLFLLLFCVPYSLFAINGNGTYGSPYNGSLTTDMAWNGTVYINGDVTVNGYTLTIDPGAIIVFLNTGADLIITGTGVLHAVGSESSIIRFTADSDNSGTYGDPGETWGHLSFQGMGYAGTSNIEYCVFEYGKITGTYQSGDIKPVQYGCGGAIYTDFSDIVIKNCTFRSNYAYFGGAIYIDGTSPSISNCSFVNNESMEAGGAISIFTGSGSLIENCLFQANHASGITFDFYSGGAIFFGPGSGGSTTVVNSTFVNNTSDRPGDALYFYSPVNYIVKNCILWGSNVQVTNGGSNIINCAIQTSVPSGSVNCITLNSSNTNPLGPNFTDPNNKDWSIKVISPCLDAGTSSGAPSLDYLGKSTIGIKDIGAYEVQYNGWKTTAATTDWNTGSNWDQGSVPVSSSNVVIPAGAVRYPVGSSFIIGSGYGMVLDPGALLTMPSLTNSGDLKLRSDGTNISSLITSSSGVNAIVELYLTGGGGSPNYKWHYISIPITTLPVTTFTGVTQDIVGYAEQRVSIDLLQGWVAWDGYVYSGGGIDNNYTFTDLLPGKGYDYWDNATPGTKFTFSGQLNSSALSPITLTYGGYPTLSGWNLLGNPFPSGIDWDVVTASGYPENTGKAVYFTKDSQQYTYAAGTGIPENATSHIPPMQGFFIRTYGTSNTFTVPASAKEHNSTPRYKGAETIIPLVRLKLSEDTLSDETIVRFDETAKPGLDYDFDAPKSFYSLESPEIWSVVGGTKYAINGQPFPESGSTLSIPITVNLTSVTLVHTITATQLLGLDDYNVTLFDNVTGVTANLKTTPTLTFTASPGLITDRFILKFSDVLTGIEDPAVLKNTFNIYSGFGYINIQTLADDWDGKQGSVTVLDLSGRTVADLRNIEFTKNSVTRVVAPSTTGLYIVELRSGINRYVGKVVIK
jgi:predicted outer membrane repeat protein